jgi:rhodanese-related sulfurtransferase
MKNITPGQLKAWIGENKDFQLVDVREDWEREAFHIGGLHIPLGEILARRGELSRELPVVLYCEKGIRSSIIIQRLESQGFSNLYNLTGGMSSWKNSDLNNLP